MHLLVENETTATFFDNLLWSFRDTSFVPHAIYGEDKNQRVTIAQIQHEPHSNDILINASDQIPPFYGRFTQLLEIVPGIDTHKAMSRQRYKHYRDHGHPLVHHTINQTAM